MEWVARGLNKFGRGNETVSESVPNREDGKTKRTTVKRPKTRLGTCRGASHVPTLAGSLLVLMIQRAW